MTPQKIERKDPDWIAATAPKRIVYSLPGMEQAHVRKDLTYKSVADEDLAADIYLPPGLADDERRPAMIFIHGGYLPPDLLTRPKEWGCYVSYGQLAAACGFVGVTFNHRYYGWDYLETAMSDVNDLVSFVRGQAASLHVDENRLGLWAFSGGGPFLSQALHDQPPYIRCLVAYYAMLDVRPLRQYIPPAVTDETLARLSPVAQVRAGAAPLFVAQAGKDDPTLNEAAGQFLQAALAANATLDFSNHAAGRHAFDVLDDDERSRQIIQRTLQFIRTCLTD